MCGQDIRVYNLDGLHLASILWEAFILGRSSRQEIKDLEGTGIPRQEGEHREVRDRLEVVRYPQEEVRPRRTEAEEDSRKDPLEARRVDRGIRLGDQGFTVALLVPTVERTDSWM